MEYFEQAKISSAMTEESKLSPAFLLPLAHSDKRAAENRSLLVLLATTAIVFLSWATGLAKMMGNLASSVVCAILFFAAAYILRGVRRKREIAALTVATLEDACRLAPEKIRRDLVQKLFADKLRLGAKAHIGLKRGARPYTPQDKPGWKSVDYIRLLDLSATRKKNRGDRAAFLYGMAVFAGGCFAGRFTANAIQRFVIHTVPALREWSRHHYLYREPAILSLIMLAVAICVTLVLMRHYWLSLTEIYAYGVDCEKDSYYAVWNEASHLHALSSRSDSDQKDEGTSGGNRRRHRGGKGKKKPAAGDAKPAAPEAK